MKTIALHWKNGANVIELGDQEKVKIVYLDPKDMIFGNLDTSPPSKLGIDILASSILKVGQLKPIDVKPCRVNGKLRYLVLDGKDRVRAFRRARNENPDLKRMCAKVHTNV